MRVKNFAESYGAVMFIFMFIIAMVVITIACGTEKHPSPPSPAPTSTPPQADADWGALQPLVAANCGKCHNGTNHPLKFDSGASFKASKAKLKISNGTMPPVGALAPDVKAKMLAYLG